MAFKQGYKLWAKDVNAAGGILGRQVKLTILNDNSSPNQVVTNYQTLINTDHVDLTFGPFSSLLTAPASAVAARNGYAFVEGAGGAPSVFDTPPTRPTTTSSTCRCRSRTSSCRSSTTSRRCRAAADRS